MTAAIVIVILAVWAGVSYWSGKAADAFVDRQVKRLSQSPGGQHG